MKLTIDYSSPIGKIKPMNAVNNGPVKGTRKIGTFEAYKAAHIPYARTHDASFFSAYGGDHTVDVHLIFRDFDADPNDPVNYDFTLTDEYMESIQSAGTEVFYRLGSKIEHESKKYGTIPPKDFHKWAVICEHIIAHMNEGWADGHHYDIKYWEIWNEPNLDSSCWQGTPDQFYEFFAIVAKHLKARFPELKIGGPAMCWYDEPWLKLFFEKLRDENVPLDFYSWHCYAREAAWVADTARAHRSILDKYGFIETESILNEWNYVKGWTGDEWIYTIKSEKGIKGAAFTAAVMSICQNSPVDMLMYYDARPCSMNGMFDTDTYQTLKGYYPIAVWGEMLQLGTSCSVDNPISDLYVTAAKGEDGKTMTLLSYFTDNDNALPITFPISVYGSGKQNFTVSLLDEAHDLTPVAKLTSEDGYLTMLPNTVVVIR